MPRRLCEDVGDDMWSGDGHPTANGELICRVALPGPADYNHPLPFEDDDPRRLYFVITFSIVCKLFWENV